MYKKSFFVIFIIFTMIGCKPDLVVKNVEVTWDANTKLVKAQIANIGKKNAGNFMVYFDGVEDPISPNRRPQIRHSIPNLAKGNSVNLEADFNQVSYPENSYLGNVHAIRVTADPKNTVDESNENNNSKEISGAPIPLP